MDACTLALQIDKTDPPILTGETLEVTIHVDAHKDINCRQLQADLYFSTGGWGNREEGGHITWDTPNLIWKAGERYSYAAQFQIPKDPASYQGTFLNITWHLRARAHLEHAHDVSVEEDLVIGAAPRPLREEPDLLYQAPVDHLKRYLPILAITLFAATGLSLIVALQTDLPHALPLTFGGVTTLGLLLILFRLIRRDVAERRIGKVVLAPQKRVLHPGDELSVDLHFTPRRHTHLHKITAVLEGREEVYSGKQPNREEHRHVVYSQEEILVEDREAPKGKLETYPTRFTLPQSEAYTFKSESGDNQIVWVIRTHITIPLWPDWELEQRIMLVPGP